ncbi:recombinase family protein [Oceanobacillus sp. J11TS1]|uniref:recombinase family protein n=1 Tax=Oceanobacillus sp. J11TS1 TaxID=2807191 RepID=UPI001B05DB39|nr:recombinase family protein [Oceanobacillus sp. J11TS1]GIO22270.1 hypothetical protein J11TS1_08510 [Oceanobacillus sp. J11TS1]
MEWWSGLGYDVVSVPGENRKRKLSKLVVNPTEAQTVRKIFNLYVEGNGYKSIATNSTKKDIEQKRTKTSPLKV